MKILSFFPKLFWASIFTIVSWHCAKEQPIEANLSHLSVGDTTLTITDSSGYPYWIAPTIGHSDYLYFGKKNGIAASFTLVEFPEHDAWAYYHETSIYVIDSIRFILYSSDSLLQESSTPILYFKADSQFNESSSMYLDFTGFTTDDWFSQGQAVTKIVENDDSTYSTTELIWNLDSLISVLSDTTDSNYVRSFALTLSNSDTSFLNLFSRDATTGGKDPKIKIYYRKTIQVNDDSSSVDTTLSTIYANKDATIIFPNEEEVGIDTISGVGLGNGMRSFLYVNFDSLSLPEGALIRSALLSIPIDTSSSIDDYWVIVDPISEEIDTSFIGQIEFESDPYSGVGLLPYTVSKKIEEGILEFEMKEFLQNVLLGHHNNYGFKITSNSSNDPFTTVFFDQDTIPVLRILYATTD
tara:strand:- start:218 stop:1450 length:1233 start_codon:yes stop_codon:yes gene_type:complete